MIAALRAHRSRPAATPRYGAPPMPATKLAFGGRKAEAGRVGWQWQIRVIFATPAERRRLPRNMPLYI